MSDAALRPETRLLRCGARILLTAALLATVCLLPALRPPSTLLTLAE